MRPMIRPARPEDLHTVLALLRELAEYEKLTHEVAFDDEEFGRYMFGERPMVVENPHDRGIVGDRVGNCMLSSAAPETRRGRLADGILG